MALPIVTLMGLVFTFGKLTVQQSQYSTTLSDDSSCYAFNVIFKEISELDDSIEILKTWMLNITSKVEHITTKMSVVTETLKMEPRRQQCIPDLDALLGHFNYGKGLWECIGQRLGLITGMFTYARDDDRSGLVGLSTPLEMCERDGKGGGEGWGVYEIINIQRTQMEATLNEANYLENRSRILGTELQTIKLKMDAVLDKAEKAINQSKALETDSKEVMKSINDWRFEQKKEIRSYIWKKPPKIYRELIVVHLSKQILPPGEEKRGGDGIVYYRWGSAYCQGNSQLLYSGFLAGQGRGAVNDLCLPEHPRFLAKTAVWRTAKIHGTQFLKRFSSGVQIPCAVCVSDEKAKVIMIPANDTCPSDWITEYDGFLSAAYGFLTIFRGTSEFICIDKSVQKGAIVEGGVAGKMLSYVGAKCGSLPCSIYPTDSILPCVVCSQ